MLLGSSTIVSDSTLTIGGTDILDIETASNSPVTLDDVTVSNGNRIEIGDCGGAVLLAHNEWLGCDRRRARH